MHSDTQLLSWTRLLIVGLVVCLGVAMVPQDAQAQTTFVVNSTGDSSDDNAGDGDCDTGDTIDPGDGTQVVECTLRAAIEEANAASGAVTIEFWSGFDSNNYSTLEPQSSYPFIENEVTIAGETHPYYDSNGEPGVYIDGDNVSAASGIRIRSGGDGSTIRHIMVGRFPNAGIYISNADNVEIDGNEIGVFSIFSVSNGRGIDVRQSSSILIQNNRIAANDGDGIRLRDETTGTLIYDNEIGIKPTLDGLSAVGNGEYGVRVSSSAGTDNFIGLCLSSSGCPDIRNVIAGNNDGGVYVAADGQYVQSNLIGTDPEGSTDPDFGNEGSGVIVLADGVTIDNGNVIAGNTGDGIEIGASNDPADNNMISDNHIGVNASADAILPNGDDGVDVREGSGTTIDGNVIGGNASTGIEVNAVNSNLSERTAIAGNYIGTNSSGDDLGNAYDGLEIAADPTSVGREIEIFGGNVIGHNGDHGIELLGGEHDIAGNYIGTNSNGDDLGNGQDGIEIDEANGVSIGNANIDAQGGEDEPNVIGFNGSRGIDIDEGNDNVVWGNYIGTNENGDDLGNANEGIRIYAPSVGSADENRIGYRAGNTVPDDPSPSNGESGNVIANNGTSGMVITGDGEPVGNSVRGNLISDNGDADDSDIGIDLGNDGVTSNDNADDDADSGPNNLQNFPVIEKVDHDESTDEVTITYRVQTAAGNANYPLQVDFYAADSDASGEGAIYLDTQEYSESQALSSVTNVIDLSQFSDVTKGDHIVATATDADGNTSEFTSNAQALPVELVSIEATRSGDEAVHLEWQTASETNNAGFAVEHKPAGAEAFDEVGFVEGAGTTGEAQSYRYEVADVETGTHVFRLKQVDRDGAHEYSPEVEVTVTMDEAYELTAPYPNPARGQATLKLTVRERQPVTIALYNALGQRVRTLYDGEPAAETTKTLRVDGSKLSSGLYLMRVEGEHFSTTETVTFVK